MPAPTRKPDGPLRPVLEHLHEVVTDEVRSAALLERFRLAKAAVRDPWLERDLRDGHRERDPS